MPKRTYLGPHDAIELHGVGVVERGVPVDVPADLAKELDQTPASWGTNTRRKTKEK